MTETLHKKELDHGIEFMLAVVAQRMKDVGIAWWSQAESGALMERFGLTMYDLKTIYDKVEDAAGEKIELFKDTKTGARTIWLMKRIRDQNGMITDDQRTECEKLFPDQDRVGMAIKAAMTRCGLSAEYRRLRGHDEEEASDTDAPPPPPGYLGDVGILLKRYQDLLQEKYILESKLAKINTEIEKYKPLANVMEAARKTVQQIKENGA